jgi:isocitrate/isopropylmalate dehydrogenase
VIAQGLVALSDMPAPTAKKDRYDIVVLPGDGIGTEVAADAAALLELVAKRCGFGISLQEIPCGGRYYLQDGHRDWPHGSEQRCLDADAILLGAVGWAGPDSAPVTMKSSSPQTAELDGKMAGWSPVIGNRIKLDLYANVRPVRCLPGTKHGISGRFTEVWSPQHVDMIIVRENTEGLYSGVGQLSEDGTQAIDTRIITRQASQRVIRKAFELSRSRGRGAPIDGKKRVTCIVKNNVLYGCKLFYQVYREVAAQFPDVEQDLAIVDAFTMFVLTTPERFDVCVTTNMFGDIVTDLASVLQGGMGMAVGCNVGDHHGMFEPIHGSAPPLAGKDRANPMAMTLAAAAMLGWLGRRTVDDRLLRAERAIEDAVAAIVARGAPLTADLCGPSAAATRSAVSTAIRDEVMARL